MRKHLLEVAIAMLTVLAIVACACRATGVRRPPAGRADGMAEAKRQGDESPGPPHHTATNLLPVRVRRLRRGGKGRRGAIYARYSTRFQHSIEDQLRVCRAWAEANGIKIDEDFVFVDRAVTGKTHRRDGLQRLLDAIARDEVDVVVTFATNRLYRKMYKSLQFIDEEIVSRRKRCVFVAQNIDTAKSEFWRQLIIVFGMLDELQLQAQAGFVRAAHEGLLGREMVHGTVTFGYRGAEVADGGKTKLGRPRRRLEIDDEAARWVRQVFAWFVNDGLRMAAIARLLRTRGAPLPPRCQSARWTRLAVRLVLANRRYLGDFSYGWRDAVWQAKQGYTRQFPREKPRLQKWIPRLRIIDDAKFAAAQDRLARQPGRGGGRRKRGGGGGDEQPPGLLRDLLWCPRHQRYLTTCGRGLHCRHCKAEAGADGLYSQVNRDLAVRLICERIAALVSADAAFVQMVMRQVAAEARQIQKPDPEVLLALRADEATLTRKIDFVLDAPSESEEDRREQRERLVRLQRDRATVRREIERHERVAERQIVVPTDEQVRQEVARIGEVLAGAAAAAAAGDDPRMVADARRVIDMITGGRIEVSQQGEPAAKRGWLRGTFRPRLLAPFISAAAAAEGECRGGRDADVAAADPAAADPVEIDFREPPVIDALSDEVKSLVDEGLLMAEIADRLGLHRNRVTVLYQHWFARRGLPCPDGRGRRATLSKKHLAPPLYQRIADRAAELAGQGVKLYEVAAQLGVDRNTVTQALRWWHDQRGVPLPPGKGRRRGPGGDGDGGRGGDGPGGSSPDGRDVAA